jgi:mersacidin/lichenicidin family type 2 lantibiotic
MSDQNIIRAWKDRGYRESLSDEQRSQLPDNPAGILELSDADMAVIAGGCGDGTGCGGGKCNTRCSPCTKKQ